MSILRIKPALILDLGNHIELSFQLIPAGSFRMGSRGYYHDEEPCHLVQITRPFYLGTFPVTQQQFAKWKPEHENGFPSNPLHPAENIDWHESTQYCSWLTANCGNQLPAGYEAGLPTEAQWEYACRAGTETEYYTGDGEAALVEAGCYKGNSRSQTHAVGQFSANDLGLCDMHGNVDEWCADAYDAHTYKKRLNGLCDPFMDGKQDADRVIRGGSWDYLPKHCRSAYRYRWRPDQRNRYLGFRVCLFPVQA